MRCLGNDDDDGSWRELLLPDPIEVSPLGLAARALLLALLAVWTLAFLRHGLNARYLMGSFLHLVHLPFHEAGHVLLMPFGRFSPSSGARSSRWRSRSSAAASFS